MGHAAWAGRSGVPRDEPADSPVVLTRMIARRMIVLCIIALACGKSERMSTTELVKQVADEVRPKVRIQVMIRASSDEATADDQALLRSLEDAVERRNIGRLVASGMQPGYLFLTIEVEKTADAIATLKEILQAKGVRSRASFRVIQTE